MGEDAMFDVLTCMGSTKALGVCLGFFRYLDTVELN